MHKTLLLACLWSTALSPVAAQTLPLAPGETLLQISATGSAQVQPDVAVLSAGITTTARTAREAIDANSRAADAIMATLRRQGVAERDVQTQQINVSPQMSEGYYPTRPMPVEPVEAAAAEPLAPRIVGYVASNQLQIRIRDLDKASDLIDDLFDAGANQVYGPNFTINDSQAAQKRARADAIARLQTQAQEYAAALGKRIVRNTFVSDRGGSQGPVYGETAIVVTASSYGGGGYAPPPPPPPPPVAAGELQVSATVWGDYVLTD